MALTVGQLTAYLDLDTSGYNRGLRQSRRDMEGFQRDANGRLRDVRGRFAKEGEEAGRSFGSRLLRASLPSLKGFAMALARAAMAAGLAALKLGSIIPLVGALAMALANIAPAAGVMATALLAVLSAAAALKLAMSGVGDAVKAALDPSDPKAYAAALAKLSPNAQRFVGVIHQLAPQLNGIKRAIQDQVFAGLDAQLKTTATATLPAFYSALSKAGGFLNSMAKGVLTTAQSLAKSGVLGQALDGATAGLSNLKAIPAQFVQGLVQIGAAAAPAFNQLTGAIGSVATSISKSLDSAFKSGAMDQAINTAVGLLKQLWQVGKNVFGIVSDIFGAAQANGGGLIGSLQAITSEIGKVTSSKGVQAGLGAIFGTISKLATTVGPLIGQALSGLGPVFAALGPPVQTLIAALGTGLQPIIAALGPVLTAAAVSVGKLFTAFSPLLPVIGSLISGLLPVLTPFLTVLGQIFDALAPVVQKIATTLQASLAPILAQLPVIAKPFADIVGQLAIKLLPVLGDLIDALAPSLLSIGQSFGEVMVALAPALTAFGELTGQIIDSLMPALTPLIDLLGQVAAIFANEVAGNITSVLVPTLEGLAALLRGDLSGAWDGLAQAALNALDRLAMGAFLLPAKLFQAGVQAGKSWLNGLLFGSDGGNFQGQTTTTSTVLEAPPDLQQKQAVPNAPAPKLPPHYSGGAAKAAKAAKPKKKTLQQWGREILRDLLSGMTGSVSEIKSTAKRVADQIRSAFKDASKKIKIDDVLLAQLKASTKKLLALAKTRDKIAKTIAAAKEYRNTVRDNIREFAGLENLYLGKAAPTGEGIRIGLQTKLGQIKAFAANVKKLIKIGIPKGLLRQVLDAGPEAGGALAAALASSGGGTLQGIRQAYDQINKISSDLGMAGADAIYDAGKNKAGKGFLAGLISDQKAIESQMDKIAKAFARSIAKALGVRQLTEEVVRGVPNAKNKVPSKGAPSGGMMPLVLHVSGDGHFATAIRNMVKVKGGGNVQKAFGK